MLQQQIETAVSFDESISGANCVFQNEMSISDLDYRI